MPLAAIHHEGVNKDWFMDQEFKPPTSTWINLLTGGQFGAVFFHYEAGGTNNSLSGVLSMSLWSLLRWLLQEAGPFWDVLKENPVTAATMCSAAGMAHTSPSSFSRSVWTEVSFFS